MARVAVRGLAASIGASARRLKALAAERAATMHSTIQPSCAGAGIPPAASMAPHSANGSAKTECSHLIISRVVRVLVRRDTGYCNGEWLLAVGLWLVVICVQLSKSAQRLKAARARVGCEPIAICQQRPSCRKAVFADQRHKAAAFKRMQSYAPILVFVGQWQHL